MRWRFLLFLNALLLVLLVFSHVRAHSMPEEDGVVWVILGLGVALVVAHGPFFLGWTPPPIYVRGIDYIWVGLSAFGAAFAYMGYQAAGYEREQSVAIQNAASLLDAIEAQLVKVEAVCAVMELGLIRDPSKLRFSPENCGAERWLSDLIARKRSDSRFPLALSDEGMGWRISNFQGQLENTEGLLYIQRLEAAMDWPLEKQMRRFEEATSAGLKARWHSENLKGSPFMQPGWWVYLLVIAVAIRISKTSFEIAGDVRQLVQASTVRVQNLFT